MFASSSTTRIVRTAATPSGPLDAGLAQKARGLLGRRRVDEEARAPLETGDLRELGHDLDVPVVVLVVLLAEGAGVEDVVVGRALEHRVDAPQRLLQDRREGDELLGRGVLEGGI